MPRDRKTPHEHAQTDAANRHAQWLDAFNAAVGKLRPHLAGGASKYLLTVGISDAEPRRRGFGPQGWAKTWHEANKAPK